MAPSKPWKDSAPQATEEKPAKDPELTLGPAQWKSKKRPLIPSTPTHSERIRQGIFDVMFSGAWAAGRWEDEFPLMTEKEFDSALDAVSKLELGGQHPDGTHPRAQKAE